MIKENAVAAALDMRATGCDPGVLQRLAEDPRLPLDADELAALMSDPLQFTGPPPRRCEKSVDGSANGR